MFHLRSLAPFAPFARSPRRALAGFGALLAVLFVVSAPAAQAATVFINEIHYDNGGTDAGEAVEIAGPAGTNLAGWSLVLYNGNGGAVYDTIALAGSLPDQQNGYGTLSFATPGIQNGSPDGLALVDPSTTVVQFLSYEGTFVAVGGPANGLLSVDIGVIENGSGPVGESLQLTGTGTVSDDFTWAASMPATFGAVNTGQTFGMGGGPPADPVLNEFVFNHVGTDTNEYVEVYGDPATDYSGFAVLQIEGDGAGQGAIDSVHTVGTTDGGGFWVTAYLNNVFENGSVTLLLVEGFTGSVGNDVDADNDGLLDTIFWTRIVDSVAVDDGGAGDGHYSPAVLTPGYDGNAQIPGGASRIPDGADTDAAADWLRNDFDGAGIPPLDPGTPQFGEAYNTPGATNAAVPAPLPDLVINEIDYDQASTDTAEFVEIKNVGSVAIDLDPYTLVGINGSGGAVYRTIDLPAFSLAPGDYFVVCGNAANVINCDLVASPATDLFQNGAPDAVALLAGSTIIDTVSYEGNTVAPYTEGSGVGLEDDPGIAFSGLSRFPDGVDTDQNNVDLSPRCITPGTANGAASGSCSEPVGNPVIINEVDYDQVGGDTAEFVELKNVSGAAVDLDPYTLIGVNGSGGAIYRTIDLPAVSLAPGDYYVVCGNAANVANCDLVASPATDLFQNGAPDAIALLLAGTVVDTVSYEGDTAAPYTEGSGTGLEDDPALAFSGISRFPDGVDTDMNNVDFSPRCITPGGANTVFSTNCSPTGPVLEIFEIQGSGAASPFVGGVVNTLDNVVTALASDGFFIQTPDARTDGDVDTSDGIFVFTGGAPTVAVGDQVDVTGTVSEFFDFTELGGGATVSVDSSGNPLPAAVAFDASVPSPDPTAPSCAIEFECYESMRISIAGGSVGGPNQRFGTDPIAEVHIVAGPTRAFREPGIQFPGLPGLPVWDGNPEVFELDPDRLGLPNQIIPAGSHFDAEGVLGFEFSGYELWPTALTVDPAPLPVPVPARAHGEFTVGSLNMFRFFDDIDDPPSMNAEGGVRNDTGEVLSTAEFLRRRTKFVQYILGVLDAPDVLAVEEVEKIENLQLLAGDIAAVDPSVVYTAYLVEGNDIGTIDTGFLVRDTVQVDAVTQLGYFETYINPQNGQAELLHDRPPLQLDAHYVGGGSNFPLTVIAVHNRSLSGIESAADGPRVRAKRLAQAQSIAQKVQDLQTGDPLIHLVVIGDFNAYEFTDGFVDAVGQIAGDFDPADNQLSGPDLVDPNLTIQTLLLPAAERYSFIFSGSAQDIDHALTSTALDPLVTHFAYGRGDADAAVDLINDDATPLRSSDHDGQVLYLFADSDGDGVPDEDDLCAGTVIPEGVPTVSLGVNRYALVDGDGTFDTTPPPGGGAGPGDVFTIEDTAGCSCEQIIAALHLGQGHVKFGCSVEAMRDWVASVGP